MAPIIIGNGSATGTVQNNDKKLVQDHYDHSLYQVNKSVIYNTDPLPLPPAKGMTVPINDHSVEDEPVFDAKVHLNLEMPKYVRLLDTFEKVHYTSEKMRCLNAGTNFAYSAPFNVLSDEGVEALLEVIKREEHRAGCPTSARGSKRTIRGLYYSSKFIRDLQNCTELSDFFRKVCGERLIPHPSFSNSPQVNISFEGGTKGPVDHWHWDSVAYTGVVLLSDMSKMKGGNLEVAMMEKNKALEAIANNQICPTEIIEYEKPGKMILAQGAEILHHVTPVESKECRISMIFGFALANCFQPTKTILNTMRKLDVKHELGDYEFFREKAYQAQKCLEYYVTHVNYTNNGHEMGKLLRSVADHLTYSADLLQGEIDDSFHVMDEKEGKLTAEFNKLSCRGKQH